MHGNAEKLITRNEICLVVLFQNNVIILDYIKPSDSLAKPLKDWQTGNVLIKSGFGIGLKMQLKFGGMLPNDVITTNPFPFHIRGSIYDTGNTNLPINKTAPDH